MKKMKTNHYVLVATKFKQIQGKFQGINLFKIQITDHSKHKFYL